MPKKESTQARHQQIWRMVYNRAEQKKKAGEWPNTKPAIIEIARELQLSPHTVSDIYYGRH